MSAHLFEDVTLSLISFRLPPFFSDDPQFYQLKKSERHTGHSFKLLFPLFACRRRAGKEITDEQRRRRKHVEVDR